VVSLLPILGAAFTFPGPVGVGSRAAEALDELLLRVILQFDLHLDFVGLPLAAVVIDVHALLGTSRRGRALAAPTSFSPCSPRARVKRSANPS
jgi:hypothetical protein